jgi:hypothetical protein
LNQKGPAAGASRSFGVAHAIFSDSQLIIVCSVPDQNKAKIFIGLWLRSEARASPNFGLLFAHRKCEN